MKTFQQFLEQTVNLPSNYTDYKAPAVQAAHARSMGFASRLRQAGMNVIANDPKEMATDNLDPNTQVVKPLPGTTGYSPLKKQLTGDGKIKAGDPGVRSMQ